MQALLSYISRKERGLFNVCVFLFKSLKINFTNRGLSDTLVEHVDYPSFLSLRDALFEYGIESAAIKKGRHSYDEFETPFICSIQKENWPNTSFTIVTKAESDKIEFLDPVSNKMQVVSIEDFDKIDKNIILLLDTSTAKDETNLVENKRKQKNSFFLKRVPVILMGMIFFVAIGYVLLEPLSIISWFGIGFILTSFFGLGITSLLIWHEIDAHNPFIKEVCGGSSKKLNCNAVLSSSVSSFWGISWSIWGFAFFATFFTTQVFFPANSAFILLWSGLSLLAAPYILFSLYYQRNVIKQWCLLCLAVQVILAVNAILACLFLASTSFAFKDIPPYSLLTTLLLGFSFLFLAYLAIPTVKKANDSKGYEKKWKNLKFDPVIFQALLDKGEKVSVSADNLGILVGNPDAPNEIIKVCNPYCGPCSKAHPELENIVRTNPDVRMRIIFTASGDEKDIKTLPVAHLLSIQQISGGERLQQALGDWYLAPIKDYEAFALKYPMNGELKQQTEKIQAMRNWCNKMKIRATPTIYVNGRELPDCYSLAELKNLFRKEEPVNNGHGSD